MMSLLAQAQPDIPPFALPGQSRDVYVAVGVTMLLGFLLMFALMNVPTRARRPIVVTVTFLAGFFYVAFWLWPRPVGLSSDEVPANQTEAIGSWLANAIPGISSISQTLAALLLGLGVYSVVRYHSLRLVKKQKDWIFSLILLLSMLTMVAVGYTDYNQVIANPTLSAKENWQAVQITRDFLFQTLQAMDAAMFSIIAFFILFAAYRAFRIRSVESTVLLATALIVMLSLMGGVEYFMSTQVIDGITGGDPGHFMNNFAFVEIRSWITQNVQLPGIQALAWGVGIGALSMGLRLWLSLEKSGGS